MRFYSLLTIFLASLLAGCSCGPNYYGPGLGPRPYGGCVGTNTLAPPSCVAGKHKHRQTLAERKQARELRKWYRELNDAPGGYGYDDSCPHCRNKKHKHSPYHGLGYADHYGDVYNDVAYYDEGMLYGDGIYDGMIVDGGMMTGTYDGSYCPDCQSQQFSHPNVINEPMIHQPMMEQPVMSEPAPAPPAEPVPTPSDGTPAAFLNELYSPQPAPLQQVPQAAIPPVEQVLYAPPTAGATAQ